MFYDRQVKYFDYLVRKERCGNAGFLKIEVRENICNINICVNGLGIEDSFPVTVYLVGRDCERELCSLEITGGKAIKQLLRLDAKDIAGTGISYRELEMVKIPISAEREIYCVLEKSVGQAVESCEPETSEIKAAEEKQSPVKEAEQIEELEDSVNEAVQDCAKVELTEREAVQKQEIKPQPSEREVSLHDSKWMQLWEIYPHIRPFRDTREYLSVGPGDFVILPEKYFCMANNSFLLHGYYNYKHLLLKRMENCGEIRYYIGVPGNYYDREKRVAVMFGFESFECMQEPAGEGDFGYYLMRIEL